MRMFALSWMLTTLLLVNLRSLPSLSLSAIFIIATLLVYLKYPQSRSSIAGVCLSFISLALTLFHLAGHQLHRSQVSVDLTLTVRIDSVPQRHERGTSFIAEVLNCQSCDQELAVERIKLSWYQNPPTLRAGDIWQLTVRLKPPVSLRNTGTFDAVAFTLVKNIHAKGYVRDRAGIKRISENSGFSLSRVRQQAAERLQTLTGNNDYLGLLQGLTVGVKTEISDEQWEVLRSTGTAHLLAISGLHVGLIAAWVLFAGQWLSRMAIALLQRMSDMTLVFDARPWILTCSLFSAAAYAALAGFELPTQRAVLMLGVWMIAALRFRFLPPLAALCMALIAVMSINSLNVLSAGFWLSFGTVGILFYLHRGHLRNQSENSSVGLVAIVRQIRALGTTHILLGIALLPVSAWFFQAGSLVAPLANLIAVPWVAMVCVPLSLAGLLLGVIFEPLASPVLSLATGSLQLLLGFLGALDLTELSSVVITMPSPMAFFLVLLGLLVIFTPTGLSLRFLAVPLFLPALIHNTNTPATDGFEVHVLDVGQGLAALVFHGEKTLLFDTGGRVSSTLSMFDAVVVPFLQESGRRRVDMLVVSHGDEDHAFGVGDVIQRFPDVQIYSSQALDLPEGQLTSRCVAGTQWKEGAVQFGFLHPGAADRGSDNNLSCVLLVQMGTSRVLLTGDIEAAAEHDMLSRIGGDLPFPVTLLTAPHHGSKSSSTQAFVDKLRPRYVVFPSGRANRYGFPHSDVQLRYKLAGSESFVTSESGAVSFAFGPDGLLRAPLTWWISHRRFWHGIVNPDCWHHFAGKSLLLRLRKLSQDGQILCGK